MEIKQIWLFTENRIHAFNLAQEQFPGLELFYRDDAKKDGCIDPFDLMSYERGQSFNVFMQSESASQGTPLWIVLWQCPLSAAKPEQRHKSFLYDIIRNNKTIPFAYRQLFERVVQGKVQSARDFAEEMAKAAAEGLPMCEDLPLPHATLSRHKWLWESCFICAAIFFLALLYTLMR